MIKKLQEKENEATRKRKRKRIYKKKRTACLLSIST